MKNSMGSIFSIIILIIIIIGVVFTAVSIKKSEEGCPFIISRIITISTGEGGIKDYVDDNWTLSLMQNNDIYLYIEKNKNMRRNKSIIEKVTIENIKVLENSENRQIDLYSPSKSGTVHFETKEDYKISDKIEYIKGEETIFNITDDAGIIGFRQVNKDIIEYIYTGTEVIQDGKLLKIAGVTEEQLKATISFDVIIETNLGSYKANLKIEVPAKDLLEQGKGIAENTNLENIIFEEI